MREETWHRAKEIFLEAIELAPADRQEFAREQCGEDGALYDEICSLLDAHREQADFIESPAFSLDSLFKGRSSLVGKEIGHYKILSELGHGGMGAVFLAERSDGEYEHRVAIKIIRPGFDTENVRTRFLSERQILADLEHPYIARLIDGGTTEDGIPFLVMEYVEGVPVTEYCTANQLSVVDTIALFRKICEAVAFAHRKLVIHRDLKPSNIFVTNDGQPRLLDFGIAKLLDPASLGRSTLTNQGAFTPDYASPEQVRGESVSTSTDVYSLGIVLYEVLTGALPYKFTTRSPEEIVRVICETQPMPPNRLLREATEQLGRGPLDEDLANIVLLALRKEPERRYLSVEQFSDDLDRYLRGMPVMAREDTVAYRATKFVSRHRYGATAIGIILLTLVAGLIATAWQASIAYAENRRAQRINTFLRDMLGSAAPEVKGADLKVKDALDEAAKKVRVEFQDDPGVVADVLMTIGRTYLSMDLHSLAETELRDAVEASVKANGERHPVTVASLAYLGIVLGYEGKFDEGEAVAARAVSTANTVYPDGHADLGVAYFGLCVNLLNKGDIVGAEDAAQRSSDLIRRFFGESHGYYLATLTIQGVAKEASGDLGAAEDFLGRAARHPNLEPRFRIFKAQALAYLSRVQMRRNAMDEARASLAESEGIYVDVIGPSNPTIAHLKQMSGQISFQEGDLRSAEAHLRASYRLFEESNGIDHPIAMTTLSLLGQTLTRTGRAAEGEPMLRRALTVRQASLPQGNPLIAVSESALGECLLVQKKFGEAEPLIRKSLELLMNSAGPEDPRTVEAQKRLDRLDAEMKKRRAA